MKKKIIIPIPFNLKWGDSTIAHNKWWIDRRMEIFMSTCAIGFQRQTNQNFLCLMLYEASTEQYIQEALARYPKLPDNIIFTSNPNEIIQSELTDVDFMYEVTIDSDNIYHRDFIEQVDKTPYYDGLQCILCQNGYIYDLRTRRLAEIFHASPSCYALIYKKEEYLAGYRYPMPYGHWSAGYLNYVVLPSRMYMLTTHDINVDNKFNQIVSIYGHGIIRNATIRNNILADWGLI